MEQARLVRWLKNVGDPVSQGEPLLELETEKSVVEIEATVSGRLVEQLVQVDQAANVGDRVGWLETDSSVSASSSAPAPKSVQATGAAAAAPAPSAATTSSSSARANGRIRSSPVARRLAAQNG